MPATELHITGAFGIKEILAYQSNHSAAGWNFPQFFPFWQVCPDLTVRNAAESEPHPDAILLVINLNPKTWDGISSRMDRYARRILLQLEAYEGWEFAYEHAGCFDDFLNFDPVRGAGHPGFRRVYIPYDSSLASSHRDQRGRSAWLSLWKYSKRRFLDTAVHHFLPRRKKAVMIAALGTEERYQIRLRMARRWADWVDVYGRGWPKDLPNYRGICISKLDILRQYRYALVFENQPQPGYVTEKLLDAFVAGTVPLYHGAPDAEQDIPAGMFVPFIEDTARLDEWIQDDRLYKKLQTYIQENSSAALAVYDKKLLIQTLKDVVEGVRDADG